MLTHASIHNFMEGYLFQSPRERVSNEGFVKESYPRSHSTIQIELGHLGNAVPAQMSLGRPRLILRFALQNHRFQFADDNIHSLLTPGAVRNLLAYPRGLKE